MHMSGLSGDDTKHIAFLAKLDLSSDEIKKFAKQISAILDYMKQLDEVDIKDVEPTAQTTNLTNILRKDKVNLQNCLSKDEALSGTENIVNGDISVPKILNKND